MRNASSLPKQDTSPSWSGRTPRRLAAGRLIAMTADGCCSANTVLLETWSERSAVMLLRQDREWMVSLVLVILQNKMETTKMMDLGPIERALVPSS